MRDFNVCFYIEIHKIIIKLFMLGLSCLDKNLPRGYKKKSCSTQRSMNFFLLINIKMPTILVGILTFIPVVKLA